MKKRKAVVLYGSLTGNTEMVGRAMAEIIKYYFLTTSGDPRPPYAMYTCIS